MSANSTAQAFAQPTPKEMLGKRITAVFYRPFARLPIVKEGRVAELKDYKSELFMFVVPDQGDAKWVSEHDWLREQQTAVQS